MEEEITWRLDNVQQFWEGQCLCQVIFFPEMY